MIMYHPDQDHIGQGNRYWKGWLGINLPSAGELSRHVLKYANSPCMWGGGIRNKLNFRFADWFGLDFDEGLELEKAKVLFAPFLHVIATTKSHQVEKAGKTCDRFRVFLRFGERCKSVEDYEATAAMLINKYNSDAACKDAARFFWPCKEIVVCKYHGKVIQPVDGAEIAKRMEEQREARRKKLAEMYNSNSTRSIPCYIQNQLSYGVTNNRNTACYKIAASLTELGWPQEEIFSTLISSAIPLDSSAKVLREVRGAVARGHAKGFANIKSSDI